MLIREKAERLGLPVVDAIIQATRSRFQRTGVWSTLLAVCPTSQAVVKGTLLAAKENGAPLVFAATLTQVDTDGGYTGWRPEELVQFAKESGREVGFAGTSICALDHGGPWLKDAHRANCYTFEQAMAAVRLSIAACIDGGYEMLHIDPTVDIRLGPDESLPVHDVAARTLDLIEFSESHRRQRCTPALSYEVGTEEVRGGVADQDKFRSLLERLKEGLAERGLSDVWPLFVVGKVGTDLHTTEFDSTVASELARLAANYGSVVKGHYTDWVSNPEAYPLARLGGANVGPEFSEVEYDALLALERKEPCKEQSRSRMGAVLQDATVRSGRWMKWLQRDEFGLAFDDLSSERRRWLTSTCSRYVWRNPEVRRAREVLARSLSAEGVDVESTVVRAIADRVGIYLRAFGLVGAEDALARELQAD